MRLRTVCDKRLYVSMTYVNFETTIYTDIHIQRCLRMDHFGSWKLNYSDHWVKYSYERILTDWWLNVCWLFYNILVRNFKQNVKVMFSKSERNVKYVFSNTACNSSYAPSNDFLLEATTDHHAQKNAFGISSSQVTHTSQNNLACCFFSEMVDDYWWYCF